MALGWVSNKHKKKEYTMSIQETINDNHRHYNEWGQDLDEVSKNSKERIENAKRKLEEKRYKG